MPKFDTAGCVVGMGRSSDAHSVHFQPPTVGSFYRTTVVGFDLAHLQAAPTLPPAATAFATLATTKSLARVA
jgi:hypothetical protein